MASGLAPTLCLEQLPTELLIHILSFIQWPRDLYGLGAANQFFHALVLQTPILWREMDTSDDPQWISLCAGRAGATPLLLHTSLDVYTNYLDSPLTPNLIIRSAELDIRVSDLHQLETLISTQSGSDEPSCLPLLRELRLEFTSYVHEHVVLCKSTHQWPARLRSLTIGGDYVVIESFPNLWTLSELDLSLSDCYPGALRKLISRNKFLQTLKLALDGTQLSEHWFHDELGTMTPSVLPHLRHASVSAPTATRVEAILTMIPDPSHQLLVKIRPTSGRYGDYERPTLLENAAPVFKRVSSYWQRKTGNTCLPPSQIEAELDNRRWCLIGFGALNSRNGLKRCDPDKSSLFHLQLSTVLDGHNPIFDLIHTMRLDLAGRRRLSWEMAVASPGRNLDLLTCLRKLVLINGKRLKNILERRQKIVNWLEQREEKNYPKLHLELVDCSVGWEDFGMDLKKRGLVEECTWI